MLSRPRASSGQHLDLGAKDRASVPPQSLRAPAWLPPGPDHAALAAVPLRNGRYDLPAALRLQLAPIRTVTPPR